MSSNDRVTESEIEFDLPFGSGFRIFEVGFFAVALAVSLTVLIAVGGNALLGGSFGLRSLLAILGGAFGGLVSIAGGKNAVQLLRDPRPALKVLEEGIINRTYWNATTLVRWDEIVDIRRTRFPWISEIVLTDPESFRSRQILPIRLMMRLTSLLGVGSLPVYLPQMAASREEVSRRLSEALEARELAAIREQRRLESATGKELPPSDPEQHTT